MKHYIFKNFILILLLALALSSLTACDGERSIYIEIEGLTAKIPSDMRKTQSDYFDLYYTTLSAGFGVVVLDGERLASLGERADITLDEYIEVFLSANGIDREASRLYFNAKQNAYRLTYLVSNDGVSYFFHNVLIAGGTDAIYYVDISCSEDKANSYAQTFELWANSVRVK